jgi:hypothetical protein
VKIELAKLHDLETQGAVRIWDAIWSSSH